MEYRLLGRTGVSVSPLRRLNTDYIDLYQMHRPSVTTDVEETLGALTDLVHQGKVRYIGSSSYSASQEDILPRAQRYGRGTLVYSPLSGGWLTGRWRKDAPGTPTSAARPSARFDMSTEANQRKLGVVEELALLAERSGMTMIELALAWAINHPGVTSAIIGPRTME